MKQEKKQIKNGAKLGAIRKKMYDLMQDNNNGRILTDKQHSDVKEIMVEYGDVSEANWKNQFYEMTTARQKRKEMAKSQRQDRRQGHAIKKAKE